MQKVLSPVRILLWAVWTACCITFAFIAVAFTFSRKTAVWLSRHLWAGGALFIPGIKLTITGTENVDFSKPHVYVANHQSYMDIPCIMRGVEAPIYFVAKKELKKIPFLGWFITISDMIYIDRSNRTKAMSSLKEAAKKINGGKSILAFPEGTRSKTGELAEFKKGAFLLAIDAQVPIVPVTIVGTKEVFPATKLQFIPGKVKLHIGKPIATANHSKETANQLIEICRTSIINKRLEILN